MASILYILKTSLTVLAGTALALLSAVTMPWWVAVCTLILLATLPRGEFGALFVGVLIDGMFGTLIFGVPPLFFTALTLILLLVKRAIVATMLI